MTPENNKILVQQYDELKEGHSSQKEIDKVMGELCMELEYYTQSQIQAEYEAAFETHLQSLPDVEFEGLEK